jgi:hypothetical protein
MRLPEIQYASAKRVSQLDLFEPEAPAEESTPVTLSLADLLTYDTVYVGFSGGKDSLACVLHLLELGYPRERIELHHHLVDGRESAQLMDFPVTEAYCRAVAQYLGIPIYMSWKVGGFEGNDQRQSAYCTYPLRNTRCTSYANRRGVQQARYQAQVSAN